MVSDEVVIIVIIPRQNGGQFVTVA